MAVSKHNLWKRKKNGLMKLVRSNKVWKKRQNLMKAIPKYMRGVRKPVTTDGTTQIKPGKMTEKILSKSGASSTKRTQVGKKI